MNQPTPTRRRSRASRGYLMMEVMVGGALTATVIGALIIQLGFARTETIVAARLSTARQLAQQGIELQLSQPFASMASGTESPVANMTGRYERETTVTTSSVTLAGTLVPLADIVVTVTYRPDGSLPRIVTTTSRRYGP